MRRVALRGLVARRARVALTALAVALGVTLMTGTYVFTDTINGSFDRIFTQAYESTDAVVTPRRELGPESTEDLPPIDAAVLDTVRGVPGIAEAEGGIFSTGLTILGKDGEPLSTGGAPQFATSVHESPPFEIFEVAAGRLPRAPRELALMESTVDREGFALGDRIPVQGRTPKRDYTLVGVLEIAGVESFGGAVAAMFTLPEAQRLVGKAGKFDEIDATAEPGVTPEELKRRLREVLPANLTVRTGSEEAASQSRDIRESLGFLRTALLAFAGIALFVGAFIIFNTFSITVAQRTREFALLRTLGAKRRQVMGEVLVEGLAIGGLGALAGLGLGVALASGLRELFSAVGVDLPSEGTVIATRTVVVSLLVGVVVTLASAIIPAVRATRVPPMAALREGAVLPHGRGARLVTPAAVLLCVAAVALVCVGLFADLKPATALSFAGGGAAAAFVGVALLSPRLVGPMATFVAQPLERVFGLTARLARENAVRQPGRTATTAAALMVGVTMFAFASIFAASARSTVRSAVEQGSRAQLILQNTDGWSPITPQAGDAVARVEGVERVTRVRFARAKVAGVGNRSVVGIEPETFGTLYDAGPGSELLGRLRPGQAAVAKTFAENEELAAGDTLRLRTARSEDRTLEVIGVVDDPGHLTSPITVTLGELDEGFGADEDGAVFVGTDPARAEEVQRRVDALLERDFPQVEALSNEEFIDEQAAQIDQLLALIYALLALTVIVALFGIVNTLVLSITERTRELGMLRAIGASRRQLRRMIRYEAIIIGLIGGVLGIAVGTLLALLVSRVVEDLTLSFPVVTVLALLVLAAAAGILASVVPARRAARLDVLRALAYE